MTEVTNLDEYKENSIAKQLQEELCLFDFNGHQIETVVIKDSDGKDLPLFQGKMVADVLKYGNPAEALQDNCLNINRMSYLDISKNLRNRSQLCLIKNNNLQPEKSLFQQLLDSGWKQTPLVTKRLWIPESDVYRLVMRSNKPDAKLFQDWVVETVLPYLRKDGMYVVGEEKVVTGEMTMEEMELRVYEHLKAKVDRLKEERDMFEKKADTFEKKAETLQEHNKNIVDQFITDRMTATQFCKQLNGVNVNQVQNYLRDKGILYKKGNNWKVYGSHRDTYLTERTNHVQGSTAMITTCYLTKKGAIYLYKKYLKGELPMKKNWDGEFRSDTFNTELVKALKAS